MNPSIKALVLSEMVLLFAGGLATAHQKGTPWTDLMLSRVWKQGLAVAILLGILTLLVDLGFGGVAAMLGLLIDIGYLAAVGNVLGPVILDLEKGLFDGPSDTGSGGGSAVQ